MAHDGAPNRAPQPLLRAQLQAIGSVLDASRDGYGIWKTRCGGEREVVKGVNDQGVSSARLWCVQLFLPSSANADAEAQCWPEPVLAVSGYLSA